MFEAVRNKNLQIALGILFALGCVVWLSSQFKQFEKSPAKIAKVIRKINSKKPETILLGNSMLGRTIDKKQLQRHFDGKILKLGIPGTASARWFLLIENILSKAKHQPKYLILFFRNTRLTDPSFRVTGKYFYPLYIRMGEEEPEIDKRAFRAEMSLFSYFLYKHWPLYRDRARIQKVLENWLKEKAASVLSEDRKFANNSIKQMFIERYMNKQLLTAAQDRAEELGDTSAYDFEVRLEKSFLPLIVSMLRERNIKLLAVSTRTRGHAKGYGNSRQIRQYISSLANYFNDNQIPFLDVSSNNEIKPEHFARGDHLNKNGRNIFTEIFAEWLKSVMESEDSVAVEAVQ